MILDELQYQKYLLENRSEVFTGDEIQRLKKIFSTPSNYIKKNHDETAVYCFWAYSYLLTIEKFYGNWIITNPGFSSKSENTYQLFTDWVSVIREIQSIVSDKKQKLFDYRAFSDVFSSPQKIDEKLGVATQIEPAVETIYKALLPITSRFLESNLSSDLVKISIPWASFKIAFQGKSEDFIKFPLEKVDMKVTLGRVKKLDFRGKYTISGLAQNISQKEDSPDESILALAGPEVIRDIPGEIEKTITGRLEFSIRVSNVFEGPVVDNLYRELRATISHELAHLNEFYQRHIRGRGGQTFSLSWAGGKNYNIPKSIWKPWYRFHYLVYLSEPYEQNAVVQEAHEYVKSMSLDEFKRTTFWEKVQKMKNFSWQAHYLTILEAIDETSPHLKDSILGRLKNWFVKDYKQLETKETNTKLYKDIESIQDVPSLMKLFERRINQAGRDMERKLLRLFSLKD
jgi:hypothetical protein